MEPALRRVDPRMAALAVAVALAALAAGCGLSGPARAPDPARVLPLFPRSERAESGERLFLVGRQVPGGEHHVVFRTTAAPFDQVAAFYRASTVRGLGAPRERPGRIAGTRAVTFAWPRGRDGRTWFVDVLRPEGGGRTVIALGWAR